MLEGNESRQKNSYTTLTEGYDLGVGTGRIGRMIARMNELLGR